MITDVIKLNVNTPGRGDFEAYLKCYIPMISEQLPYSLEKKPAVIVCPGGAYEFRCDREDEPVALQYAAEGFAAFVLEYSVGNTMSGYDEFEHYALFPQALCEAATAIKLVKDNAEKWNIDPDKVFICGFSAGGHLACSAGTMYGTEYVLDNLGGKPEDYRPAGMILAYPVVSANVSTHIGSFRNLLGADYTEEKAKEMLSLEKYVNKDTPSAFIWATSDDQLVPVENSLTLAMALRKNGIRFQLEIFHSAPHGLSLSRELTDWPSLEGHKIYAHWMKDSINWVKEQ